MNVLTRIAVAHLIDEGYVVIPPTDPRPLPIYDDETALQYVRGMGYTAIKTRMPSPPRLGTCWKPTRGKSRGGVPPKLEARWVRSVGASEVSYALTEDGSPVTISIASWHGWVRKTRAVRV